MATKDKDAPPSIADVMAAAQKQYGLRLGSLDDIAEDVTAISTGNLAIDHIIGVHGVPIGRCIECFGPPSSGKTTTGLQTAVTLQKIIKAGGNAALGISADDVIAFFDYEQAMDPEYCRSLGLDTGHPSFIFAQPDDLEQGANTVRQLLATGKLRLSLWDSVAAMTPSVHRELEIGASRPMVQAKLMSDFLKVLTGDLNKYNSTAIFLNHEAEVVNMGGARRPGMPPQITTPGGRALKYYASVRLQYAQIATHKSKVLDELSNEQVERVMATDVRVRVIKNKVAAPFKQAVVRVRFGRGFDNFWSAMQVLIAHKKVVYSTGYYYFEKSPELVDPDMKVGQTKNARPYIQGESSLYEFADTHDGWRDQVIASAETVLADLGAPSIEASAILTEADADQDIEPTEDVLEAQSAQGVLVSTPSGGTTRTTLVDPASDL